MHAIKSTDITWSPEGKIGPKGLPLAPSGDNLLFVASGPSWLVGLVWCC